MESYSLQKLELNMLIPLIEWSLGIEKDWLESLWFKYCAKQWQNFNVDNKAEILLNWLQWIENYMISIFMYSCNSIIKLGSSLFI